MVPKYENSLFTGTDFSFEFAFIASLQPFWEIGPRVRPLRSIAKPLGQHFRSVSKLAKGFGAFHLINY